MDHQSFEGSPELLLILKADRIPFHFFWLNEPSKLYRQSNDLVIFSLGIELIKLIVQVFQSMESLPK